MSHRLRAVLVALLLALASLTAVIAATLPSHADVQICDQWGTTTIQDRYVVQNNRWGTTATQCINVTGSGFQIIQADGSASTSGPPKSYPSAYLGCHYTNCSPGSSLPKQVSTIGSLNSSISYTYAANAVYNASYDIWLDPAPKRDGVNQTEIMIWFNRVGPIQPIGRPVGDTTVGGRGWEVWTGSNGSNNVISFVTPSAISSWSFDVMDFVDEAVSHGLAANSWYVTSVQAGFEPWQGGIGLAVNSFSATVDGDGEPTPTPTPTTPAGACRVGYSTNTWPGGFTANVTVTNTSAAAINGWSLGFTLPLGQTITNAWNAELSPASGAVTARNQSYNSAIPANGSQSFGFQGGYSSPFDRPAAFTLNGTRCTGP